MTRRRLVVATAVAIATTHLSAREALGDDVVVTPADEAPPAPVVIGNAGYLRLRSSARVMTDGGADLRLPPGYYLDEPNWNKLDAEVRRLQDAETRLTAENQSFRASLGTWQPGWKTLLGAVILGGAGGWYLGSKL